jgi:hypothetical protein
MDAKQRRLFIREMERLGLPVPDKRSAPTEAPESSVPVRLLFFVEQPLFLSAFGVLGSIVGLIYTPILSVTGLCIVAAFHRAGVVRGRSWRIQFCSYALAFAGAFGIVYLACRVVRQSVQIPSASEIAAAVVRKLQTAAPIPTPNSGSTTTLPRAQLEPEKILTLQQKNKRFGRTIV